MMRLAVFVLIGASTLSLSGCFFAGGAPLVSSASDAATTVVIQTPNDVKYYRSDEALRLGQEYFNRGIYGTAERHFQRAVESAPKDVKAWIGLAATYDRLARFDLADRAYQQAIALVGETPQILNNLGYSFMLRGQPMAAREKFIAANNLEPGNPTVLNNIDLLNGSVTFIQRDP